MLQHLTQGWKLVSANRRTLLLISLYQLLWTTLLYIIINTIVTPFLRAMPTSEVSALAPQYFWLEARFLAAKTDILHPYIYLFIGLLLIRMIISPFIQSGVYGVLARSKRSEGNNKFMSELKQRWKPFLILYWAKMLAILTPLFIILLPLIKPFIANFFALPMQDVPVALLSLLLLWSLLITYFAYGILIGLVNDISWQKSITILLKKAIKLITVVIIVALFTLMIHTLFQIAIIYLLGAISIALFFLLPIIRTFLKAWTISTHMVQFEQ